MICASFLFALFFLFVLQLDWRGETLEVHFLSWMRQSSITKTLQKEAKIIQITISKKFLDLKRQWIDKGPNKKKNRLNQISQSITEKFKRSLSNADKPSDYNADKQSN